MRTKQHLLVEQLDQKIKPFLNTKSVIVPERGWIHTIRTTINMTMDQLGSKLGMTRQGVKRIEDSESKQAITLSKLNEVAHAMDMKLVYAIVPNDGTMDDYLQKKAEELAKKIILRTHQSMKLEGQEVERTKLKNAIKDLSFEIKKEIRRSLWD